MQLQLVQIKLYHHILPVMTCRKGLIYPRIRPNIPIWRLYASPTKTLLFQFSDLTIRLLKHKSVLHLFFVIPFTLLLLNNNYMPICVCVRIYIYICVCVYQCMCHHWLTSDTTSSLPWSSFRSSEFRVPSSGVPSSEFRVPSSWACGLYALLVERSGATSFPISDFRFPDFRSDFRISLI